MKTNGFIAWIHKFRFYQLFIYVLTQERILTNFIVYFRFGRKKPLVYCMFIAAIASAGAVLCTMYDPGDDKGMLVLLNL